MINTAHFFYLFYLTNMYSFIYHYALFYFLIKFHLSTKLLFLFLAVNSQMSHVKCLIIIYSR